MPLAIYLLGLTTFAMTSSEFMVAGILPELAGGLGVSVPAIGYLVSAFAAAMVIGGPLLTLGLLRARHKPVLLLLTGVFLVGQTLGAVAPDYAVMLASRVIAGVAESAFFGVAVALAASLVGPALRGRAASLVFGGIMLGSVVGVPATMVISQHVGWRGAFWAVAALTALAGVAILAFVPSAARPADVGVTVRAELAAFRNPHLWASYATTALLIGAAFSAFSYLAAVFTWVSGFDGAVAPALMFGYGAATVVGNAVVGRFADRHTMAVLTAGLVALTVLLVVFALFAQVPWVAVAAMVGVGLSGVSLLPAVSARTMRVGNDRPLVATVATATANVGIVVGPSLGAITIGAGLGLTSPLWVGAALAALGLLSLAPYLRAPAPARTHPAPTPDHAARCP
ncbi:MFS transporter [Pseudonocardia acaciae]|uniref:MFS transporter n=1 Tax=Pseudonocardia acaciae TaxID=551276 RepID=UPI0004916AE6|nr:MFS transporter [Pseudonocardia acaciae]